MIHIIEASESDLPAVRQIAQYTWPHTFGNILSPAQIDYMLDLMYSIPSLTQQIKEQQHRFLLAKESSDCLGYASYEPHYQGLTKTKIHKLYILPNTQGKGIGKLFIHEISKIAKQNHDTILSLNVNRDNPAIHFYEKLGFIKVGQEDIPIGNGFLMEDFIMEMGL
ncbi:MAG: GNAT family N-acetyltransferase [Saprospiraceae bacterium]|nr:GNAT family N-acetyltransferase [Saprospiraceae bacterium]